MDGSNSTEPERLSVFYILGVALLDVFFPLNFWLFSLALMVSMFNDFPQALSIMPYTYTQMSYYSFGQRGGKGGEGKKCSFSDNLKFLPPVFSITVFFCTVVYI